MPAGGAFLQFFPSSHCVPPVQLVATCTSYCTCLCANEPSQTPILTVGIPPNSRMGLWSPNVTTAGCLHPCPETLTPALLPPTFPATEESLRIPGFLQVWLGSSPSEDIYGGLGGWVRPLPGLCYPGQGTTEPCHPSSLCPLEKSLIPMLLAASKNNYAKSYFSPNQRSSRSGTNIWLVI